MSSVGNQFDASRREMLKRMGQAGVLSAGLSILDRVGRPGQAQAATSQPNILMIVVDEERDWEWLPKTFDFSGHFPARQWLKDAGVRFTNYYVHTAPCSPSRSIMYTGRHTDQTGVFDNVIAGYQADMAPTIPTVGTMMRNAGYKTAYRGKWHLESAPRDLVRYGFDDWIPGDYDDIKGMEGFEMDEGITLSTVDYINTQSEAVVDQRPWFLTVNLINPHDVAAFPSYYNYDCTTSAIESLPDYEALIAAGDVPANWQDDLSKKPGAHNYWQRFYNNFKGSVTNDKNTWAKMLSHYVYFMKEVDRHVLTILDALAMSGQLENTVIVFTSDHGELGGAHGLRAKGPTIYREQYHVPLVVVDPRLPHDGATYVHRGVSTQAFGGSVDLAPLLMKLADPSWTAASNGMVGADLYSNVLALNNPATASTKAARDAILFTYDARQGSPLNGSGNPLQYGQGFIRGILGYDYRGNMVKFGRYCEPGHVNDSLKSMQWELYDYTAHGTAETNNLLQSWYPSSPYRKVRDGMNDTLNALISKEMKNSNASGLLDPPTQWPSVGCQ